MYIIKFKIKLLFEKSLILKNIAYATGTKKETQITFYHMCNINYFGCNISVYRYRICRFEKHLYWVESWFEFWYPGIVYNYQIPTHV